MLRRDERRVDVRAGREEHALHAVHVLVERDARLSRQVQRLAAALVAGAVAEVGDRPLALQEIRRGGACRPAGPARPPAAAPRGRSGRPCWCRRPGASPTRRNRARTRWRAARRTARRATAAGGGRAVAARSCGGAFMAWNPSSRCPLRRSRRRRLRAMKSDQHGEREREPLDRVTQVPLGAEAHRRSPGALVAVGRGRIEQHDARFDALAERLLDVLLPWKIEHPRPALRSPGTPASPTRTPGAGSVSSRPDTCTAPGRHDDRRQDRRARRRAAPSRDRPAAACRCPSRRNGVSTR